MNFTKTVDYFFFDNTYAYYDFIEFLKSKENDYEHAFHFIDYFNKDLRKIVFTSLSDKGRVIVKFKNEIPLLKTDYDFTKGFESFKNCFEKDHDHLAKFLKSSLIKEAQRFDSQHRMQGVFEALTQIVEAARINFEVYLNNLSIDTVRKDYDQFKSKYFTELSEILSKITTKIISLPITIAALVFALSKIPSGSSMLYLLVAAIVISSVYLCFLLKIHFGDLHYLSGVFDKDYHCLTENNFFQKHPEELDYFQKIQERLKKRIDLLKIIAELYYWTLQITNVIIIFFVLDKLGVTLSKGNTLLLSVLVLIVFGFIRNALTKNNHSP